MCKSGWLLLLLLTAVTASAAERFYVNPNAGAAVWVKNHPDDPRSALIARAIAAQPSARWFTGTSQPVDALSANVAAYTAAARRDDAVALLVAYNIPGRDCSGGASAGGAADEAGYKTWIDRLVRGIGARPAIVILEPDAIADADCLPAPKRRQRFGMLAYAAAAFRRGAPAAQVYLDAGNPGWKAPAEMARYLNQSGVKALKGFALNVSNFYSTEQNLAYGDAINRYLLAHFGYSRSLLIDTSRNGNGASPGDWCNPPGRKLGVATRRLSPDVLAAWIKTPGNSDGSSSVNTDCHHGPAAGSFSPALAAKLISGG
ncbi:endoglucanase [Izhakiella australiensis]|uniref:Glucanase n=1 Tax=Izhakiella australiensis TaxID=1926881 RepID=A0A1S8YMN6_9GAMM|nr:glycoside hydrolase family 6 protein [Izhakiella australiensis]OON40320.1 endoglucanase [Izhakiella australiensis]